MCFCSLQLYRRVPNLRILACGGDGTVSFCPVLSCVFLSYPVLSCSVPSCPILFCPILSYPVLSHPALTWPDLSCLALLLPVVSFSVLSLSALSCPHKVTGLWSNVYCLLGCGLSRLSHFILVLKVGWILSELDDLQLSPPPPVSVLPIGTGNDLSRELNWGAVSQCVIVGYRWPCNLQSSTQKSTNCVAMLMKTSLYNVVLFEQSIVQQYCSAVLHLIAGSTMFLNIVW